MSSKDQWANGNPADAILHQTVFSSPAGARPVPPPPNRPDPLDLAKRRPSQALPEAPKDKADSGIVDQLQEIMKASETAQATPVSRADLAVFLERVAHVMRNDREPLEVNLSPMTDELLRMKTLLLDAQETIIKLLHDRVYDRSRIAQLESEVRLMPDLQAQATRAMKLALQTDDFEKELSSMADQVGQLRSNYLRSEAQPSWWRKILRLDK
jgi:hypothetical protein